MKGLWTLPNFITLVRLATLPFFLLSIAEGRFGIALTLFVAAGISDGVDGIRHSVRTWIRSRPSSCS